MKTFSQSRKVNEFNWQTTVYVRWASLPVNTFFSLNEP